MAGRRAAGSRPGPKKESSSPGWVIRKPSGKTKRERREQDDGEAENREPESSSRRFSWRKNEPPGEERRSPPGQKSGDGPKIRPEPKSRRPEQQFQQNKRPRPGENSGVPAEDLWQVLPKAKPVNSPPLTSRQRMAQEFEEGQPMARTGRPLERPEGLIRQEKGSRSATARQPGDRRPPARPRPAPGRYENRSASGRSDRPLAEFKEFVPEHRTRQRGTEPEGPGRQSPQSRPAPRAGDVRPEWGRSRDLRIHKEGTGPVTRMQPGGKPQEAPGEKQRFPSRRNTRPKSKRPAGLPLLKHEDNRAQKRRERDLQTMQDAKTGGKAARPARKWGVSERGRKN